ncbi:MAG: caspase family protein [Saprospiraceae bacterium]|nr:caspase family protein [Saprospiraceae bacterium]
MKPFFTIFILASIIVRSFSQEEAEVALIPTSISSGNIYALIIGISEYKHDSIRDLHFAHKDAEAFYEYLTSASGGMVPTANIRLLVNEQATVSNIYVAKRWLETVPKKDDVVFFYFAGHGDVENSSVYQLGFLLAYDTPYQNYFNNALRIEDINIMANSLSISKGVNVYLITDACHSGKLAGTDNRGRALTFDQLMKTEERELRLASCKANQEAEEDTSWGGGRGAFSYFLIEGLKGKADRDTNRIVTFEEIKSYVEKIVPEQVNKVKQKSQNPVSLGEFPAAKLAIISKDVVISEQPNTDISQNSAPEKRDTTALSNTSRSLRRSQKTTTEISFEKYFSALSVLYTTSTPEVNEDFKDLRLESDQKIIEYFLTKFNLPSDSILKSALNNDPNFQASFKQQLAATMHDRIQQVINKYLEGDDEEIEKRMYYSYLSSGYNHFPAFTEVAMKLLDAEHPLYKILEVKLHYFQGLIYSLKLPLKGEGSGTIVQAIEEQKTAYSLEKNAAYIMNELGLLYAKNKESENADKFLKMAVKSAPKWPVALANLSAHFADNKLYDKGIEMGLKAVELKGNYQFAHLHLAKNYEKKGNLYSARKHYFETLKINSRPYFGYERLGIIALKTQDYKLAEKLFEDSEKRKSKLLKDGLNEVNNKNAETLAMLSATIENKNPSVIQADQYILSGDTTKVDSILSVLSKSPSVSKSELNNLYVKHYFLTNKFLPALEILKRELSVNPKNADIEYSIARCYAMMDKSLESRNALLDAVQHGFKYKWVYQYDAVFNKYKNEWHRIKDLIHQNSKI